MTKNVEALTDIFPSEFSAYLLHNHELAGQLPFPVTQAGQQMHGDQSQIVTDTNDEAGKEADAFISNLTNHFVGVRMADCAAILLADPITGYYAAIHSGWKGSKAQIVPKTIARLQKEFGVEPENLTVWIGPLACHEEYEVGPGFDEHFPAKYLHEKNKKTYFDNRAVLLDQLKRAGVTKKSITVDSRCTLTDENLPSARRQGTATGKRMLAVITKVA